MTVRPAHARRLLLLALVALSCLSFAPTTSVAATGEPSARASSVALVKAKRQLAVARRLRAAACRRGASAPCRVMRARAARQRARLARLRLRARRVAPAMPDGPVVHVSGSGRDSGAGTAADPLATLGEALRRATGGEVIRVGPGTYPRATDQRARTKVVTVVGPADGTATVRGMTIEGGQELDVRGLHFTDIVVLRYHPTHRLAQPARGITFRSSDFTAPAGQGCLTARNGVRGLSVIGSRIHDCTTGFGAGAGASIPQSSDLTFAGNTFERFTTDAIQFGQWNDVRITGNTIAGIRDPAGKIHNDGIQLTGNSQRVVIAGNRISDSRTQLIFIQDAVGPIDDVTVENNLVHGAGAVAIQSQGATNSRFVHNTVWGGKDGGLWLTQGYTRDGAAVVPTDTVVVNNILSTYRRLGGAWTATSAGNAIACLQGQRPATNWAEGWSCFADLGFLDPAARLYRLRPDSPVRDVGSTRATVPADIDDVPRARPVPGAFV